MRSNRQAVSAAVLVALVMGIPVSAAAIRQTASARAAQEAALTERLAVIAASSQVDAIIAAAVPAAATRSAHILALESTVAALAAEVAEQAVTVAEDTIAFRDLSVRVAAGETWQVLAERWGLSGTQLAALNPRVDINRLHRGQELIVYRYHPELPSVSHGTAARGRLINGMPLPAGEHWIVRTPERTWGTNEAVSGLVRGFTHVAETLPGGGTPMVADMSRRRGGRLHPHRSHTSGRDADVTYYRNDGRSSHFDRTHRSALDLARQWELFSFWIERDRVSYIFIDHRLSFALYNYALSQGEDPALLEKAFGEERGRGILRYSPGHDDHFHVRFVCADTDQTCRD